LRNQVLQSWIFGLVWKNEIYDQHNQYENVINEYRRHKINKIKKKKRF
jgi:alpha-glucosidase (family GH31 glycosyl hydrolase)